MDTVRYIDNSVTKQNFKNSVKLISDTTNQNRENLISKKVGQCGHPTYSFSEKGNFSLNFFPRSFLSNCSFVLLLGTDSESLHRKASLLRTSKLSDQNDICMRTTEWYTENIRKAHGKQPHWISFSQTLLYNFIKMRL